MMGCNIFFPIYYYFMTYISLSNCNDAVKFVGDYSMRTFTESNKQNLHTEISKIPQSFEENTKNNNFRQFREIDEIDWKNELKVEDMKQENNQMTEDEISEDIKKKMLESLKMAHKFSVFDIFNEISSSGNKQITNFAKKLKASLIHQTNDTENFQHVNDDYFYLMNEYYRPMHEKIQKAEHDLDIELYVLDVVDTANRMLEYQINVLIMETQSTMKHINNETSKTDWKKLQHDAKEIVLNEKKRSFSVVCTKIAVCRKYPVMSDYLNVIIGKILMVSNTKFNIIAKTLRDQLQMKIKYGFLRRVISEDVAKILKSKFDYIDKDISKLRGILAYVRYILMHRHEAYGYKEKTITVPRKALRILIDLMDRPFAVLSEKNIQLEINELVNIIQSWANNETIDIQMVIVDFINKIEVILTPFLQLTELAIEVKTLIDLLVIRSSKFILNVDKTLLTEGSKYSNIDYNP